MTAQGMFCTLQQEILDAGKEIIRCRLRRTGMRCNLQDVWIGRDAIAQLGIERRVHRRRLYPSPIMKMRRQGRWRSVKDRLISRTHRTTAFLAHQLSSSASAYLGQTSLRCEKLAGVVYPGHHKLILAEAMPGGSAAPCLPPMHFPTVRADDARLRRIRHAQQNMRACASSLQEKATGRRASRKRFVPRRDGHQGPKW